QANRQGIFVFVILNGLALILCLHIFYGPWWEGKSRGEWLKAHLRQRVPFLVIWGGLQYSLSAMMHGRGNEILPRAILIAILVVLPLLWAIGMAIKILRRSRRNSSSSDATEASACRSMTKAEGDPLVTEPS